MNNSIFVALCATALLSFAFETKAQDLSISTNVAGYANFGTLNMEASYGLSRHWSLNAGVKYNPFTFDSSKYGKMQNRQQLFAIGTRFWPWHIFSGWWLAGKVQYQEYNTGGIISAVTTEGDRFGGALTGGYTYMVNPHFNIEFGLGLWGGYEAFTEYECPVCGNITDKGKKFFLQPNDLVLSLSYVF